MNDFLKNFLNNFESWNDFKDNLQKKYLAWKNQKPDLREYTIKIIPHQNENVRSIRIPIRTLKIALAALTCGVVIFVGTVALGTYNAYFLHSKNAEIDDLKQVNSLQQEQLLQLAKKASSIQDEMQELQQLEKELRQIVGTMKTTKKILEDDGVHVPDNVFDGQGGPWIDPNTQNVNQSFDNLQQQMKQHRATLEEVQKYLTRVHLRLEEIRVEVQERRERQKREAMRYAEPDHHPSSDYSFAGGSLPSIWPADGEISSPYGMRWGGSDFHPGMDIANYYGTPICATADGVVTDAGWNSSGYGNMVCIDHGNGIVTLYAHAQEVIVNRGETVRKGQIIAYMGSTGFSTGPHVHYEVQINGSVVNPANYLY